MRDRRDGTLPAPVALAGGRTLTVRPVSAGDVEALLSLYRSLPETDLYRRFFQAHLPPRTSIEQMAGAALRGDIGLVAEVHEPDGTMRLVGEAACAVLPDGDGELALTVASSARGWLGPYLLALLCDEAAARGLPNIQADVLQDNHPMLALAQARGYATMDHSECPSTVRVVFNSVGRVPTWPPGHDRRRVLVEVPGARWHAEAEARAAGLRVLVCPGPTSRWCRCPAVAGRPCPLAAAADAVVDGVDPDTSEAGRALLRAHHEFHARTPILLEGPPAAAGVLDRLLELLPPPPGEESVADASVSPRPALPIPISSGTPRSR